jgi:hypothetical protein
MVENLYKSHTFPEASPLVFRTRDRVRGRDSVRVKAASKTSRRSGDITIPEGVAHWTLYGHGRAHKGGSEMGMSFQGGWRCPVVCSLHGSRVAAKKSLSRYDYPFFGLCGVFFLEDQQKLSLSLILIELCSA